MKSIVHQEQLLQLISMRHITIGIQKYLVWENLTVFFKLWYSEKISRLVFLQGSQALRIITSITFHHFPATLLKLGLHWRCFSLNLPKPLQQLLHRTPVDACTLFSVFGIKKRLYRRLSVYILYSIQILEHLAYNVLS